MDESKVEVGGSGDDEVVEPDQGNGACVPSARREKKKKKKNLPMGKKETRKLGRRRQ
jgi:hypothetical protein